MIWTLLTATHLLLFAGCNKKEPAPVTPEEHPCMYLGRDTCRQAEQVTVTVKLDNTAQVIHSFGASDAWTCKFIGQWANLAKKQQIADWLFSLDTLADGSPRGIGLSLWRFNIGSGSYEQGQGSNITDEWRREECFLDSTGAWNWNKQAGQQWFLEAARQRGVAYTLGFSLTPPVFMTLNGKAFSPGGTSLNIKPGKMQAYADFMVKVSEHFRFNYLSPFNEPQWGWAAGNNGWASQEGSPATNQEMAAMVKLLSPALAASSPHTQVVIGEAGQLDFLYGRNNDGRGDQIAQFFTPGAPHYIGGLPNVAHTISAHSYFTTCPENTLLSVRQQVAARVGQVDPTLSVWQSEFGILGDICKQYNGSPRNTTIDYGLYIARVIHHDLTIANVTSWQWWLAVSPYNYSDALVYINDPAGNINVPNCKQDGIVLDSKQLWCFGNYARFVRPGMQRVQAEAPSLLASAYKHESSKQVVVVLINESTEAKVCRLAGDGHPLQLAGNTLHAYTTGKLSNLKHTVVPADSIPVEGKSVVTLVGNVR